MSPFRSSNTKRYRFLDKPRYDDLPLIADRKVYDLGEWRPDGTVSQPSLVTMRREVDVGEHLPERLTEGIRFRVETSGDEVYVEGVGGATGDHSVLALKQPTDSNLKSREITFGKLDSRTVASRSRNWWFPNLTEKVFRLGYNATYHNAFQDSSQWWVGSRVYAPASTLSLLVRFPENYDPAPESVECRVATGIEGGELCEERVILDKRDGSAYAYWETNNPELDMVYRLKWYWHPDFRRTMEDYLRTEPEAGG